MDKIDSLSEYIKKCDDANECRNYSKVTLLIKEIVGAYSNEIQNLTEGFGFSDERGNLAILRGKLVNYRDNLYSASPNGDEKSSATYINQNVYLNFVINNINTLNNVSNSDKTELNENLLSLEKMKSSGESKDKLWEKAKSIIGWILDKSVDVGIAALPYIVQTLQTLK